MPALRSIPAACCAMRWVEKNKRQEEDFQGQGEGTESLRNFNLSLGRQENVRDGIVDTDSMQIARDLSTRLFQFLGNEL